MANVYNNNNNQNLQAQAINLRNLGPGVILGLVLALFLAVFISVFIFQWGWNTSVAQIFSGVSSITMIQALALLIVAGMLFRR